MTPLWEQEKQGRRLVLQARHRQRDGEVDLGSRCKAAAHNQASHGPGSVCPVKPYTVPCLLKASTSDGMVC
jgi:hypothetical protein